MQTILVTGGLGYIGSHVVVELLKYNHYKVIIIDNLSNSSLDILNKIEQITSLSNHEFQQRCIYYNGCVESYALLYEIFFSHSIDCVIHLAGLKSVNDSIIQPIHYYQTNIGMTLNLLHIMDLFDVKKIIFSSSSTVYGNNIPPFHEEMQTGQSITNPYGKTKYMIEEILKDLPNWSVFILRYFNPIGAHSSGLIGDNPNGIPNNIMPYLLKVANGTYPILNIYGNTYNTFDGTAERDFIHIEDLARAHVLCINQFKQSVITLNIGTGKPTSVLQLIETFQRVNQKPIPYCFIEKREGDIETSYSLINKASEVLQFQCHKTIDDMCKDAYHFISMN